MQFNSFAFCVFLPVVFLLYWALHRRLQWQNAFLLATSYLFYGWWDWRFLLLIAFTTLSSFVTGLRIDAALRRDSRHAARGWLTLNVVVNLGVLALFKYFNFFIDSVAAVTHFMGMRLDLPTLRLILPVGISFYTFQALSYSIDIYRRTLPATRDAVAFAAFISFFPQLVAGPIERASSLLPQMLRPRHYSHARFVDGCRQMLAGLLKKVVVADTCALAVDRVWIDYADKSGVELVVGMVLFAMQVYCDFSGYSDIAVGAAKLFGIELSRNFRLPFQARSFAELWRRWHISLMTWFRDYVYFPLGGSRRGVAMTLRNNWVVFLLSGLWHGANWTYVAWGAYNAAILTPGILLRRKNRQHEQPLWPGWCALAQMSITFLLFAAGLVLFRAPSLTDAVGFFAAMCSPQAWLSGTTLALGKKALFFSVVVLLLEWLQRRRAHLLDFPANELTRRRPVRWLVYYAALLAVLLLQDSQGAFIYFQF